VLLVHVEQLCTFRGVFLGTCVSRASRISLSLSLSLFFSVCGCVRAAFVLFAAAATLLAALRLISHGDGEDGGGDDGGDEAAAGGGSSGAVLALAVGLPVVGLCAGRFGVAHLQRRFKVD